MHSEQLTHDVIILGTGIGGTLLGTILARHGKRVLMIEKKSHPRFAIGESTVPQTSWMLRILADRYDVPELDDLSSSARIRKGVSSGCGVKRNFGFVYHRKGEAHRLEEANQVGAHQGEDSETHLLRQDVDAYVLYLAVRYGAELRQNTGVTDVEIDASGVRVVTDRGETFTGRYLADGTGHGSILARKYDLRENPTRLKTDSRSIFTHMVGVRPFEECVEPDAHRMPGLWSQGTLHHLFDGGWLWVIPFNNHEHATNPLCSVGLLRDSRRFPRHAYPTPEEEFRQFLGDYPSIAPQFEQARPVRDWVSTGRIQFSSKKTVGDRFCLLSHAAGFVDALFSRGLVNTTDTVNVLASLLLEALEDDDFSAERFAYLETLQQNLVDHNDRLVHCSFVSFRNFHLWNAWYRVWVLGAFLGVLRIQRAKMRFDETGDRSFLDQLQTAPFPGALSPDHPGFQNLFDQAATLVEAVERGEADAESAARSIFRLLAEADFAPPMYPFADPELRSSKADENAVKRVLEWVETAAPPEMKNLYFDVESTDWV